MIDDAAGVLLLLFCVAAAGGSAVAGDSSDAAALLAFKSAADPGNRLDFPAPPSNDSTSHCRWPSVSCSPAGRVVRLVLVSSGITGFFAPGTLDRLDQLRILSLQDNSLAGPIPDLSPLLNLRAIFLGHNSFSGRFPSSILSLHRLRVLDLSGNHLAGPVPPALASLDRLVALRLDSNRFNGSLPAFDQSSLKTLNVSFNNFSGEIPTTAVLSSFVASSFASNPALCGEILRKECGGDAHKLFSHRDNDSHNRTSPAGASLWQNSMFNLPASSPSQKMLKRAVVAVGFLAIAVVAAAAVAAAAAAAALGFLRVRGFGRGGERKAMSSLIRELVFLELKKLMEANPLFRNKLQFPNLKNSNQSLNWQHQLSKNPSPNPDIKTHFVDHSCGQSNGALAPSQVNNPPLGAMPEAGSFPPLGANGPFQPAPTPVPTPLAGWMSSPAAVTHPAVSGGPIGLNAPTNPVAILKHPRTLPTTNPSIEYASADSEHVSKRTRPLGISEEVNLPVNILPVSYPQNHNLATFSLDDLPKTVVRTLSQGSNPMSMDFHPVQQTILLVGTNVGDVALWDVGNREILILKNFKVWELGTCSMSLQASLVKYPVVSVNRIIWSPDGSLFGVAYSKHIVQIYAYHGGEDIRQHLEIDAHVGGVNDIAFAHPNKQLSIITCGDDKTIRVWDATSGTKQHTFEGHEAPVYSVCPHHKENIQFIFSTALDGKIKAWLYDNLGSRVDYDAPGHWCTTMAYSADGSRLFSCGTSKEGDTFIVEWNESEGAVKRTYQGFRKHSLDVVQFDTTRNRFLAAGDEFLIKFWDMDNINLLTTVDADGVLPASSRIRFNKEGTLLAVSTCDNGIKILANADGLRLLRTLENRTFDASRAVSETPTKPIISPLTAASVATTSGIAERTAPPMAIAAGMNGEGRNMVDVKPRIADESTEKSKIWKPTEVNEPAQCRSLRLPDSLRTSKISRLIYTNSGGGILALASNAIHLIWKWPRNERHSSGKATTSVAPQLWQPPSGILMTNEITDTNPEEAVHCFALSMNDSYVMSASGGKISLFNMMTFKTMTTFMSPPPAATFIAFHPQDNNIIAIGMEDSTIQIYNVRVDEVKSKLRGHSKRITGLAFSNVLNVLVSSGADAQLCVFGTDGWEKQRSRYLQIPSGRTPAAISDTRVQFHHDQIHFLAVHETQIALYETTKLECVKQWSPREGSSPISHATFSCDSQSIYACFLDATISIFNAANLTLYCRVLPAAYLVGNASATVYPLVVAAHPSEPNQFAIGMTDGGVYVLEPLESDGKNVPVSKLKAQAFSSNYVMECSSQESEGLVYQN